VASNTGVPMRQPGTQAAIVPPAQRSGRAAPQAAPATAPAPAAAPPPEPVAAEDTSSWLVDPDTLLLVEDDPGDALLVEELIADSGVSATLTWVRSLAEAHEWLRAAPDPGCILLDLNLPDALGMEAVRQVIAAAPAAPVVVLTGLAEEGAGLAAVAAGAQDYLIKGQSAPDVFLRAIRYAAQRKHVEQASAALQISALRAEENARLERGLLPSPLLHTKDLEVVARYRPGRSQSLLGGDFYDVVETQDGTVHAVIGDVSGHGAAEAAIGVCLRVAWRSLVLAGLAPQPTIELLEQVLVAERDGDHVFTTLTHLVFPPVRDRVTVLRAGHPGLLLRTGTQIDMVVSEGGPALGLFPGLSWEIEEIDLPAGSSLVLFTDGLFEGRTGPGSERLGEDGLLDIARRLAPLPSADFVDSLIDEAEQTARDYGGLDDDVAVIHLRWEPQP
jgi:serine phosphatase RsbU (regulator of sigma subunit)